MAFLGWKRILSYCLRGTSSSFSIWAEMATMRPVMVGISDESGRAMPPFVCRFGSSLRTRTRAPIGSTYSKVLLAVLAMLRKTVLLRDGKWVVSSGYKRHIVTARAKTERGGLL